MLTPLARRSGTTPHKHDDLLKQIAESDVFRAAPVMRALLIYLWNNQGQPISEYAIATEALGRPAGFDPKSDSTVRVQVARLRAKLKEFYETAGESFPLRLNVPLGGHELQWTYRAPVKSFASKFSGVPRHYLWGAAASGGVLLAACIGLAVYVHVLKEQIPAPQPPLPRFWQSFIVGKKPVVIVLPSPVYFSWPSHHVLVRDLNVAEYTQWETSPFLKSTAQKWGPPELAQTYVGAQETTAGTDLLQYLDRQSQPARLTESRRFPAESYATQNTIFLGMPRTATYLNHILEKTNYYIASVEPDVIKSRTPRAGEPAEFREISYSADRVTAPSIITLLPTRPEHTRVLLLFGRHLTAMSSMLVTPEGLRLIDDAWTKAGSPEAWEMVVQAEFYRDTILKFEVAACRPIATNFWK